MKLFIISIFISIALIFACLIQVKGVSAQGFVVTNSPNLTGEVKTPTGAPVSGVWVKWVDGSGNIRYAQTNIRGQYIFESWQEDAPGEDLQAFRDAEYNTWIDTNLDGTVDSRKASTNNWNAFGCANNTHTLSVVPTPTWNLGSAPVTVNFSNTMTDFDMPDFIVYTSFDQEAPVPSCNGSTPTVTLTWAASSANGGAVSYTVWYLDQANTSLVEKPLGLTTTGLTQNITTANGLIAGHNYSFIIVALSNSTGLPVAYSNNGQWSHEVFGGFTPLPNCSTPPGAFNLISAGPGCDPGTGPRADLTWTTSSNANLYTAYYRTPPGSGSGSAYGNTTSAISGYSGNYSLSIPAPPMVSGQTYNYRILATNSYSSVWSDAGTWIGNVLIPAPCGGGGGPFSISAATPYCYSYANKGIGVTWSPYSGATSSTVYTVWYRTQESAQADATPFGNTYTHNSSLSSYGISIPVTNNHPTGLVAGNHYEFIVFAETPGNPTAYSNSGLWTANPSVGIGWQQAPDVCPGYPAVTFEVEVPSGTYPYSGVPVSVNQNASAVIRWSVSQATSASSSWGGPITLTAGANPGTPFTVNTSTPGLQTFTLNAANGANIFNQNIFVNVVKYPASYIQTTGGDVHTNETIYITPNTP